MPSDPANDLIASYHAKYGRKIPRDVGLDEDRFPDVEVFEMPTGVLCLRPEGLAVVDIAWLEARPQLGGHGTRILRDLTAAANAHGVTLKAIPIGKERRIIGFYERHGFTGPCGDYWIREPSTSEKPPTE
jgi:GNAT superfamily N-acetyltransferase